MFAAAGAEGFDDQLRAVLGRGDDYASGAKPDCDWEDPAARDALVAGLAADASAVLAAMQGRVLSAEAMEAAELLAAVVGQDLDPDARLRIARRVAVDRVITTVDRDARRGRKSTAGGFDGYKGHIAVDPDSELITNTAVTAGNAADASTAPALIKDLLNTDTAATTATTDSADSADSADTTDSGVVDVFEGRPTVYGDSAYGSGEFQQLLRDASINSRCRTQSPAGLGGLYSKDRFSVDLNAGTVTCPAGSASRSAAAATATTPPASPRRAPNATSASCAPRPKAAEPSASANTKLSSPTPATAREPPPGRPTTTPLGP